MASLRRKPSPDVASADAASPLAVDVNTSPAPSLDPVVPHDDAAAALKRQLDAIRLAESVQQQAAVAAAAQERRNAWFQSNPLAQQHYDALNHLHGEALQSGLADTSPAYFDFLNNRLATLQTQHPSTAGKHLIEEMQQHRPQEPPQPKPTSINAAHVSAPVSREIPSANGQRQRGSITLTAEDREFAKIAGISEAEYARQKQRLLEMKANGEIQ